MSALDTIKPPPKDLKKTLLECEARSVIAMKTLAARQNYLEGVDKKRGIESGNLLRAEIKEQWGKK